MPDSSAVGIDLGTTYSAAAYLPLQGTTSMIPGSDGNVLTPSAVLFTDSAIVVGHAAKRGGILNPEQFAECVKRDMGNPVYSRPIRGRYLPPEAIQAYILRKLKSDIERTIPADFRTVITVPAFFDEPRRKATADTGEMAGLDVLDIVNEPTAAALAFAEQLGYLTENRTVREPLTVLVYDLGGGTFDVTVVVLAPDAIRTLATDGDVHLGGRDWDLRLAEYAAEEFAKRHREDPRDNPVVFQRLLVEVEDTKRILSGQSTTQLVIDHSGMMERLPITRPIFEDLTEDLLARTAFTTREVVQAAKLQWKDISRVLLCGGATRMPAVHRMLESLTGRPPETISNPDEAVARGAALYCGYRLAQGTAKFNVADVNSHSLGIAGVDISTGRKRNAILIPRNSPLPATCTREFVTKEAGQPSISVTVLEGENSNPDACTTIGRTVVAGLPPALPAGWPVKVTYTYGRNGRLTAYAQVPGTDREAQLDLERERTISAQQVSRWRHVVESSSKKANSFDQLVDDVLAEITPTSDEHSFAAISSPAPECPSTPTRQQRQESLDSQSRLAAGPSLIVHGQERTRVIHRRDLANMPPYLRLIGHVVFSLLGLAIGYYVLCWLDPRGNFLHLELPGIDAETTSDAPALMRDDRPH